jgi:hypothetical protein
MMAPTRDWDAEEALHLQTGSWLRRDDAGGWDNDADAVTYWLFCDNGGS